MTEEVRNFTLKEAVEFAGRLTAAERYQDAAEMCRGVLIVEPENFDALSELGIALTRMGRHYEAYYRFDRALKQKPNSPAALLNFGTIIGEMGHVEEACGYLRKALSHDRENATTWNNLGNLLERCGRYAEALAALNNCLEIDHQNELALYNRGIALSRLKMWPEAIGSFDRAISVNLHAAEAYYNRSIAKLTIGDYHGGWADYEWRFKTPTDGKPMYGPFPHPRWNGHVTEQTVLVLAEQGIGDAINFMRYVPLVARRAKRVLLAVHEPLRSLAELIPGVEVLAPGTEWPSFHYQVHLASLPHVFGTTLETIPSPWQPVKWKPQRSGIRRVGICWAGYFRHKNDANRSILFKDFARILDVEGVEFVSLQHELRLDDEEEFRASGLKAAQFEDMADTARAILDLDLVISVDTSTAHLAATMGAPTWILLSTQRTDFRWMQDREDSPWYPSARLIRQTKPEWDGVLRRVRRELSELVERKAA